MNRRSRVGRHPGLIQPDQHSFGLDSVDPEADQVAEAGHRRRSGRTASTPGMARARGPQPPGERHGLGRFRGQPFAGQLGGGGAEPGRGGHVLETGSPGPLLGAADQQRWDAQPPADEQRAHTFGARRACERKSTGDRPQARRTPRRRGRPRRRRRRAPARPGHDRPARPPPTGWMVPTSWLAHWQCTRARPGSGERRAHRFQFQTPGRVHRQDHAAIRAAVPLGRLPDGTVLDRRQGDARGPSPDQVPLSAWRAP